MRYLPIFITALVLLSSCETVYFKNTHPKDGREIKKIPKEFHGIYFSPDVNGQAIKINSNSYLRVNTKKDKMECRYVFEEKDNAAIYQRGKRIYWNKYDSLAQAYFISVLELKEDGKMLDYITLVNMPETQELIKASDYKYETIKVVKRHARAQEEYKEKDYIESFVFDLEDRDIDEFIDKIYAEKGHMLLYKNIEDVPAEQIEQVGMARIDTMMMNVRELSCEK